jgi:drug/metabolite transporter (DMT)-like permease
LTFVIAIQYTSIGNAVIFANSQAILLLAGKAFVGSPILCMEATGALVAFAGAILCANGESKNHFGEESHSLEISGDVLAAFAAFGGVGYLTFAKSIRHTMSVTVLMFLVMFTGSFLVLAYMMVVDVGVKFSMNDDLGLFGWLNFRPDRLLTEIWIVLVCNVMGTMGFLNAMQHFDNLIIAVATLMEPMVASLIAYALRVGDLPGLDGWIGNILVVVGTIGVVYPSIDSGGGGH